MDDIYRMGLHDTLTPGNNTGDISILRVPGGWIYREYSTGPDGEENHISSVFVPFTDSGRFLDTNGNYETLRKQLDKAEDILNAAKAAMSITKGSYYENILEYYDTKK